MSTGEMKRTLTLAEINQAITELPEDDKEKVSDTYHTFNELYKHRCILYATLAKQLLGTAVDVWKTDTHSDGSKWDGWFVLGLGTRPGEQITYHLPNALWGYVCDVPTIEKAPEYDGHTSEDVIERLINL